MVGQPAPTLQQRAALGPHADRPQTYTKLQATKSYYSFNTLAVDRYKVKGTLTPMVVGVRQVNDGDLPSQGWVNTHLQYTHGYAMILAPSNQSSSAQPTFSISKVPPVYAPGAPTIEQPRVYFGLNNPNGGDVDYVLGDTNQPEIDYPRHLGRGEPGAEHLHGHRRGPAQATSSCRAALPSASATSTCSSPTS